MFMLNTHRLFIAALAALSVLAVAGCFGGSSPGAYLHQTMQVGGLKRSYTVYLPPGADGRRAVPLVVALHGGGSSGTDLDRRQGLGLGGLADREDVISVFPNAVERNWNDGRTRTGFRAHEENIDDVAFIRALVRRLAARYPIDKGRIYVVGGSNGGMMALRLACEAADMFAGVAAVIANMPADLGPRCRPSRAIPVMVMNGTADRIMPYKGGDVRLMRRRYSRVWSTRRTVDLFARRNGCPEEARRIYRRNDYRRDETLVMLEIYRPCRDRSEVALFTIEGGGHTWPRSRKPLPQTLVGRVSQEIDATAEIWRFFRRHRLKS